MSLSERMRSGLKEMPSNAAWMLSRVREPVGAAGTAADSARAGARDRRRKFSAAVVDAAPGGAGSVEIRMKRARDAADRARDAEERALEAAEESKDLSDQARRVSDKGRARIADVERESDRMVKHRVGEAQRAADEAVARERDGGFSQPPPSEPDWSSSASSGRPDGANIFVASGPSVATN